MRSSSILIILLILYIIKVQHYTSCVQNASSTTPPSAVHVDYMYRIAIYILLTGSSYDAKNTGQPETIF